MGREKSTPVQYWGNVSWGVHCGKQHGDFPSVNVYKQNHCMTRQFHFWTRKQDVKEASPVPCSLQLYSQ